MSEFIWRKLKVLRVPNPQNVAWTPALDLIIPRRYYRLWVKPDSKWNVEGLVEDCTADGMDLASPTGVSRVLPEAPIGALIAKIGGGTADRFGIIFSVGRYCIYQLMDESKAGGLYLGANHLLLNTFKISGQLEVEIEVAL